MLAVAYLQAKSFKQERQAAAEQMDNEGGHVYRMRFLDGEGNEVAAYNPFNRKEDCREIRLADNEQLIGIYGAFGDEYDYWIRSLGFIVKV